MTMEAEVEVTFSTPTLESSWIADCSRMELRIAGSIGESNCGAGSASGVFFGALGGTAGGGSAGIAAPAVVLGLFSSGGGGSENDCESES